MHWAYGSLESKVVYAIISEMLPNGDTGHKMSYKNDDFFK